MVVFSNQFHLSGNIQMGTASSCLMSQGKTIYHASGNNLMGGVRGKFIPR